MGSATHGFFCIIPFSGFKQSLGSYVKNSYYASFICI